MTTSADVSDACPFVAPPFPEWTRRGRVTSQTICYACGHPKSQHVVVVREEER